MQRRPSNSGVDCAQAGPARHGPVADEFWLSTQHPRIIPSVLHRTGGIQCHPRSVIGKTVAKMEGLLGAGNFRFGVPK
jgi:hypothetical protein